MYLNKIPTHTHIYLNLFFVLLKKKFKNEQFLFLFNSSFHLPWWIKNSAVVQGSMPGPLPLIIYNLPLSNILKWDGLRFLFFMQMTQICPPTQSPHPPSPKRCEESNLGWRQISIVIVDNRTPLPYTMGDLGIMPDSNLTLGTPCHPPHPNTSPGVWSFVCSCPLPLVNPLTSACAQTRPPLTPSSWLTLWCLVFVSPSVLFFIVNCSVLNCEKKKRKSVIYI